MQTPKFFSPIIILFSISFGLPISALSADQNHDNNVLASVDGNMITTDMLSVLQGSRQHGPLSDFEQSQEELLDSLITTELLFNAAKKAKLESNKEIAIELELAHKTLLSQFYVMRYMENLSFDESTLKAAYDAQQPEIMARMAYWTFDDKTDAEAFLSAARGGTLNSQDPGNELPWQTLENYPFAHLPESATLTDGQWISVPVQDELGWMVWRCIESSSIPKPSFEEAREGIRQELATKALNVHIAELREQATIQKQGRGK